MITPENVVFDTAQVQWVCIDSCNPTVVVVAFPGDSSNVLCVECETPETAKKYLNEFTSARRSLLCQT